MRLITSIGVYPRVHCFALSYKQPYIVSPTTTAITRAWLTQIICGYVQEQAKVGASPCCYAGLPSFLLPSPVFLSTFPIQPTQGCELTV